MYSLGGYDGNTYLNTMECYNSCTKQWSHVAPMHYSRSCFAAAVCDGYLYALGGYGPSYLRTVERYDPSSNSWEMMPAMSTYRINFGVGVLNGCLYVVGENTCYFFFAFLFSSQLVCSSWERVLNRKIKKGVHANSQTNSPKTKMSKNIWQGIKTGFRW